MGVSYLWVVDTEARTVEIRQLVSGLWTELGVFAEDDVLCAPPFEAASLALDRLWLPDD